MKSISVPLVLMALAQLSLTPLIGGARWLVTMRATGERDGVWPLTRLFWIGMLFSQALPPPLAATRCASCSRPGAAIA